MSDGATNAAAETVAGSGRTTAAPIASGGEGAKYVFVAVIAILIVILDQITKLWVAADMRLHQSIPIFDGWFNLTYVRNTGAAFSMLADLPEAIRIPFFVVVAIVAGGAIVYFVHQTPRTQRTVLLACAFVLGGAVGNLIDRLAYGEVIDFLDVYWDDWHWPAFNVADSFISVGVVLLLANALFSKE